MLPNSPFGLGRDLSAWPGLEEGRWWWWGSQLSGQRAGPGELGSSDKSQDHCLLELEMSLEIIRSTHLISQRCALRSRQDQVMVTSLSGGPVGAFPASVLWAVFSLFTCVPPPRWWTSAGPRAEMTVIMKDDPTPKVACPTASRRQDAVLLVELKGLFGGE